MTPLIRLGKSNLKRFNMVSGSSRFLTIATASTAPVIFSDLVSWRTERAVSKTGSSEGPMSSATAWKNSGGNIKRAVRKLPLVVLEIRLANSLVVVLALMAVRTFSESRSVMLSVLPMGISSSPLEIQKLSIKKTMEKPSKVQAIG